jgi:dissimilatory sulfite reductase (desulfoviridin) alpha/beta subunit
MDETKKVSITVLLPAGRLPLDIMEAVHRLAKQYGFGLYLSTLQNLRLIDVPEEAAETVKAQLAALGADFKGPGKFPLPRVCIGKDHCNLGVIDTGELSESVLRKFSNREHTKAKFKIAIAGCTMCCSNVKTTDIGVMATRDGYEVFAGGKGGPFPQAGRRIARKANEARVLEIIAQLVDFHDRKTEKKQRMYKLLSDPEFPFPEV